MEGPLYPVEQVISPHRIHGDTEIRAQVCVIGTGAGGAVAAKELAQRGLDVVLLEEGLYHTAADYGHETPMRSIRRLYRDHGFTFTMGIPNILVPLGKCVGGTTVINSGTALRMPEWGWERWLKNHRLEGLDYKDLVRLYEKVEPVVGVGPSAERLLGANTELFRGGSRTLGYEGEVLVRNAPGCEASGRCFIGCPTNAKKATNVSFVPRALELGARLYVGTRAERIPMEGSRAVGVEASVDSVDGGPRRRLTVRAGSVIVAAGALLSPLLLRKSGIGKRHPHFGKNLRIHPASRVVGLFDREINGPFDVPQSYHTTQFLQEGVSLEGIFVPPAVLAPALPGFGVEHARAMRDYRQMGMLGYRIIDDTRGSIGPSVMGSPVVWYDITRADTGKLLRAMSLSAEILFTSGARQVLIPVAGRETLRNIDEARALAGQEIPAADIEISAYHPHGTLRMGKDEHSGVTDVQGRVFGTRGLHVADASLFPESPIVNPMMTIMAFAAHVAAGV
ncbi:MAG: GMC family oxidoreductase [Candidatus Wallbacteria bacterium]|nr:GMC family oxidoreductase [Candidatus Wallbacteria bacterium]